IDGSVGELGERHGRWIDHVFLSLPLQRNRFRQVPRWHLEGLFKRRAYRSAVKVNGEFRALSGDGYRLVESPGQRPSRSFSLHHQRLPHSVLRFSIIIPVRIETEQGPSLAHVKRQRSGDVDGTAAR